MKSHEMLLQLLLKPAHPSDEVLTPNGKQGAKYAFDDVDGSAEELLAGQIMALPNATFIDGVDRQDEEAVLSEVQKAWVGGYVTGRAWAFEQMGLLVAMYLQHTDDGALKALADYDWGKGAQQQELLNVFSDLAVQFQVARETNA